MGYNRFKHIWSDYMDYLKKEAGAKWGVAHRMANYYCTAGIINDQVKKKNPWLIPNNLGKPINGRIQGVRSNDNIKK